MLPGLPTWITSCRFTKFPEDPFVFLSARSAAPREHGCGDSARTLLQRWQRTVRVEPTPEIAYPLRARAYRLRAGGRGAVPSALRLSAFPPVRRYEERGLARRRPVAGFVDRDDRDDVVAEHPIRAGRHVRADGGVLVDTVHVDLVYDHLLRRHSVGGRGPPDL